MASACDDRLNISAKVGPKSTAVYAAIRSLLEAHQRVGMETDLRFDDSNIRLTFLMYALGGSVVGISKTQFLKRALVSRTGFGVKMIRQLVNSPFPR